MTSKDLLLQPNQISRAAYKCDCTERKIIFFAALKVQKEHYQLCKMDLSGYVAKFRISEMLKALNIPNQTKTRKMVKDAIKTIAEQTITITDTDNRLIILNWLQQGSYDDKSNTIELVFTDAVGRLFCECRDCFSLLSPVVIGSLHSYYSMRYYELAMSYAGLNPWVFTLTIEQIRTMYQIDSYTGANGTNNFITKVVSSPINELNAINPDFHIDVVKIPDETDKRKLSAIRFVCTRTATKPKRRAKTTGEKIRERVDSERAQTADAYSAYLAQGGNLLQCLEAQK